jgi:catechol 2,3-dioxygenase-like lactoylglutathione lyase family enzyme
MEANKMKKSFKGTSRLHLALNTDQLDKSIEFYEALFNLKPVNTKPGYAKFEVAEPQINLTLNEASEISGNQPSHLGAVGLNRVSQKTFAKELGLSHSAIKSRVQRGREMLAALFQSYFTYDLDSRGEIIDYQASFKCC